MGVNSTPLRWPAAWKDSSLLSLLQANVQIRDPLIIDSGAPHGLADARRKAGLYHRRMYSPRLAVVIIVKGHWPGTSGCHTRGGDRASAGPTGEPWVDSNGWRIRVASGSRATSRCARLGSDAKPQPSRTSAGRLHHGALPMPLRTAHAGSSRSMTLLAAGALPPSLPDAMRQPGSASSETASFFHADREQSQAGRCGHRSPLDIFSGPKVGFTDEVLNNVWPARKQQYRVIAAGRLTPASFAGLEGSHLHRRRRTAFQRTCARWSWISGQPPAACWITAPAWGSVPKGRCAGSAVIRASTFAVGRLTSIAVATHIRLLRSLSRRQRCRRAGKPSPRYRALFQQRRHHSVSLHLCGEEAGHAAYRFLFAAACGRCNRLDQRRVPQNCPSPRVAPEHAAAKR